MTYYLNYLAIDLGAESGRAMLGQFDGSQLKLSEVHRFPNVPVRLPDGLHWDVLRLWNEIKTAIGATARRHAKQLTGLGVDTWGVDFGLLDRQGALVSNPCHYRDSRTDGMVDQAFRRMPREQIFELTGIQFMQLNTLYQLLALVVNNSPSLEIAETFLTMPDLFNYWLSGQKVSEFTIATTTQCYDPRQQTWAAPLLEAMGIPRRIFPDVIAPGTRLGSLVPLVAEEVGAGNVSVVAPACHDTGSAVVAVPASSPDFAWISSGTWSIMGAEVNAPVINARSLKFNLTNEGGVAGTIRLSKNIAGLWLIQECRRAWARESKELSYDEIAQMAAQAKPFEVVIDPDYDEFLKPGDMPARIRAYCQRTNQPAPASNGAIARCVLEGIALKYRWVLERLEELVGHRLEPIHIVGGGTRNRLLNQFAADATSRRVIAGPVEATATGNLLMQAVALGNLGSLQDARAVVRASFAPVVFEPVNRAAWDAAYQRFLNLIAPSA